MESLTLYPCLLKGTCVPPPSKSMAHRGLICAALAKGESKIAPLEFSDDVLATLEGVEALGAVVQKKENGEVTLTGASHKENHVPLVHCRESGSTLRFLLPVAASLYPKSLFTGKKSLGKRPMEPFHSLFTAHGASLAFSEGEGDFTLRVTGGLKGKNFVLPGDVSSQFISGLLLAAPLQKDGVTIELTTALSSKDYVEMTRQVMEEFGVYTHWASPQKLVIPKNQKYLSSNYSLERDYSQAAFFLCAGALGQKVAVEGLKANSLQGDRALLRVLEKMGAVYNQNRQTIEFTQQTQQGTEIQGDHYPDVLPVLALTMALTPGKSLIKQAGRLRMKESNRFDGTIEMLKALGANIEGRGDDLVIQGQKRLRGGSMVHSHGDHRMAMVAAIAALFCENSITLRGYGAVSKSWPAFWQHYKDLGGKISE